MSAADLIDILLASQGRMTCERWAWLDAHEVRRKTRAYAGGLGALRIRPVDDDLFEVIEDEDDDGLVSIIHGVWPDLGRADFDANSDDLVDLLAWNPRDSRSFWRYLGTATWLGEKAVDDANQEIALAGETPQPLRLHATPFAWLQGGCIGACLLDDGGRLMCDLLWGIESVICDNVTMAADIHQALRTQLAAPRLPAVKYLVGQVA